MKKLLPLAALVLALLPSDDADACHNSVTPKIDPATARIVEAERLVDNGNPKDAAKWVSEANPQFVKREVGTTPLSDRALSVLARAAVRSDGEVLPGRAPSADVDARERALDWSVTTLRALNEKHKGEPVHASYLGEALAKRPGTRAEAERILSDLAKKDVLANPYAYAALAKLQASRGEGKPAAIAAPLAALVAAKRELALHRCERMSKDKGICVGAPADVAKPNGGIITAVDKENARRHQFDIRSGVLPSLAAVASRELSDSALDARR